ncbi:MFS transporter [Acinetobacter sp. VNH17]|uniref:MFS transporter n=1 Tax=Acinetobacter thutiue TaxID=2998078 RepID=A0ABT7WN80_9GAMM|nr:MFS transporter [Acinetobacter thutiue]MCY6412004.1 MFS transporter [Acinetobacter thutiue]MDN0014108.1 MFS transporter [Acinetobacter thutiue]
MSFPVEKQSPNDLTPSTPTWSAVIVMSLCCAVLIASEFMPVSLLTPIAFDLKMTEGQVGQAIAISGIFAVMTSLIISKFTRKWDRRSVMLGLTLLMILSGVIITFAHNSILFMLGRAVLGVVIGGFWSMSTAIVMRLVPFNDVPKALGLLNGGNALATTIAAPLGSFLGSMIGWRGAFFCIVPIAIIALLWQVKTMPSLPPIKTQQMSGNVFLLLKRPVICLGMFAILFLFMGQFSLFTYLRPFLEKVTLVDANQLSILLLILGISGLVGTFMISQVLHKHLYRYLILIPFTMAFIAGAFILFGHHVWIIAALMALWGLIGTSAPVAWNTWLTHSLPNETEAGGGLMVAIIQLAITLGATMGGLLFDWQGYQATFMLSAIILVISALFASFTWRYLLNVKYQ